MNTILTKVEIENYKCFQKHTVNLNETSIIIGQNNAGKSTFVEVLRILCLTSSKLIRTTNFRYAPSWTGKGCGIKGILPSLKEIDVDLDRVFFRYGDPPAIIKAFFSNSLRIEIYFKSDREVFVCAYINGKSVRSVSDAKDANIPLISVLPQIVPLRKDEKYISEGTIYSNQYSKRISGNFRSYLYRNKCSDEYNLFKELIEQTWSGLRIEDPYKEEDDVYLNLRDRDFTAEIYCMGHGVQMWLQTMWFIAWSGSNSIIVLDEPDVYMHADLQRKLIRLLKERSAQIIIATHSIEIVSEVEPSNIVIIERRNNESTCADALPAVQAALDSIGSVHNLSLSRLLQCNKYLYVEGDDIQILRRWHNTIYPSSQTPIDIIPSTSTGGWGSWDIQKNQAIRLKAALGRASIHFLYDRDYHTQEEIDDRKKEARSSGISMHVWRMKEIENYLLSIPVIARVIKKKVVGYETPLLEEEIKNMINEICEGFKDEILYTLIEEHRRFNKRAVFATCRQKVQPEFEESWVKNKLAVVSGKKIISSLSSRCQEKYGVSINATLIASNMRKNEILGEVEDFLDSIEN